MTTLETNRIIQGDSRNVLADLPNNSVDCVMTSPPYYGLRDYGADGQLGTESSLDQYVDGLVEIFDELKGVLKEKGSLWLNLGDNYATTPAGNAGKVSESLNGGEYQAESGPGVSDKTDEFVQKQKLLVPHKVAIALQESGWIVRNDVVWHKPSKGMPESVTDRFTKSFEFVFHLVQQQDYYYDIDSVRESNGSIAPDIFQINPKPDSNTHFAVYPPELCEKPIRSTCPSDGVVLDPFAGSGTTCMVAKKMGRDFIGVELNPDYVALAQKRTGIEVEEPNRLSDGNQQGLDAFSD